MPGYKRNYSAYRATNKAARSRPGSRYRRYRKRANMGTVRATRGFAGNYGSSKGEKKVSDTSAGVVQVNTTGVITLLHLPVLGSDYNQRVGRKTLVKSIYIRGRVLTEASNQVIGTAVLTTSLQARMILLVDKQPNGAAPAVTDVLVTAEPASQLNLNNRDRFSILKDKQWSFDPYSYTTASGVASMSRQIYSLKCYKKCNVETIFNSTNGGTIADINSGAIYLMWIGSGAAGTNTDCNAYISARCRYLDN